MMHDGPPIHGAQGRPSLSPFLTRAAEAFGKPVCRLGLASRAGGELTGDDVFSALERGVNFLNWPGEADAPGGADAVSDAVAALGTARDSVVVCAQFGARTARAASDELGAVLKTLKSDYLDVLTLYYVERSDEWKALAAPSGALAYCAAAKRDGMVRRIGITSHQRTLAADIARSGDVDTLMIRYNAAHRGAEREIFPVAEALGVPIIAYTALRWGALLRGTPDDPPGFRVPEAPWWYRFALQPSAVTVALASPSNRAELEQDLEVLKATDAMEPTAYAQLTEHGERVRRHAGRFP